ncbi:glycosyltransferase [Shewanella sp. 0m-4]
MSELNFSVLMSLYHAEKSKYLDDCFDSLVTQTCLPNQIVLVLDGPVSDELLSVVYKWEDKFADFCIVKLEKNVGLGKALNVGLSKCKFDLVARVDTDDINLSSRFEEQLKIFKDDSSISICGSQIDEIECESKAFISKRKVSESNADIVKNAILKSPFNHMTVMFKKSAVLAVGGYQHMQSMEDWYLWLRLLSHNYIGYNIQSSLVHARTGKELMVRRSGLNYIGYEANIVRAKVKLFPKYKYKAYLFFVIRSLPRLLPNKILSSVYINSRRLK